LIHFYKRYGWYFFAVGAVCTDGAAA